METRTYKCETQRIHLAYQERFKSAGKWRNLKMHLAEIHYNRLHRDEKSR